MSIKREIHKIDATDKPLGRLAVEIAVILRGKHKPSFLPYLDKGDYVEIFNTDKMKITGKKMEQKKYFHHSGYLGGIKQKSLKELFMRDSREVLKKAVFGMLPKNKLRAKMIKRLKMHKGNN